jgi:hypothetical protein
MLFHYLLCQYFAYVLKSGHKPSVFGRTATSSQPSGRSSVPLSIYFSRSCNYPTITRLLLIQKTTDRTSQRYALDQQKLSYLLKSAKLGGLLHK